MSTGSIYTKFIGVALVKCYVSVCLFLRMPSRRWYPKDKYPNRPSGGPSVCDPIDPTTEVGQQRIAFKEQMLAIWQNGGGIRVGDPIVPGEMCSAPAPHTSKRTGKHWCDAHKPVSHKCDECDAPASYHSRSGRTHRCTTHKPVPHKCQSLDCKEAAKYVHKTTGTKFCAGCWAAAMEA